VARFCAEESGTGSDFSRITNVGFNKEHEDVEMPDISRLISDVFGQLEESGVDVGAIWAAIDEAISLSVLAGIGHLERYERQICPGFGYPRSFQLLGFDILLDRDLRPHVLEVNYRPSLDFYRPAERRMKVRMVTELLKVAVPFATLQEALLSRGSAWCLAAWGTFVKEHGELFHDAMDRRKFAIDTGNWKAVWPMKDGRYEEVYRRVREMAREPVPTALVGTSGLDSPQQEA
jgi:hypothetical protein